MFRLNKVRIYVRDDLQISLLPLNLSKLTSFLPEIYNFAIIYPTFKFPLSFLFINKTLRLNNVKTRTINAQISKFFVICAEAIVHCY